ncbi:unnamed protein product, partial [Polarella glacialis]
LFAGPAGRNLAFAAGPALVPGQPTRYVLPPDYKASKLVKDFGECSRTHELRMASRQKRWEMYCAVAVLVTRGAIGSVAEACQLKRLHLEKPKLVKMMAILESGDLPHDKPTSF